MTAVAYEAGDYCWSARATKSLWLKCDGSAISRTSYSSLFSAIGTAFGVGDGSTTFNLPDAQGRAVIGVGAGTGLTSRAIGAKGGEESHVLTVGEMPTHNHGVTDPGHLHASTIRLGSSTGGLTYPAGGVADNANYNFNTNSATTGISIQNQGGNGAHNNMPPYLAVGNLFIYAGV